MLIRALLLVLFTIALFFVKVAHAEPRTAPSLVLATSGFLEEAGR